MPMGVITTNSVDGANVAITWDAYTNQCTGGWPILGCTVAIRTGSAVFTEAVGTLNLQDLTSKCFEKSTQNWNSNPVYYDANGNVINNQVMYDSNGNVMNNNNAFGFNNNAVVYDANGNVISSNTNTGAFGFNSNTNTNQQVVYDANGNVINNANSFEFGGFDANQVFVPPRTCTVPVDTLISEPYLLTSGESVFARIICANTLGSSMASDVDNGAIIPRAPDMCSLIEMTGRTSSSISFRWLDGISDGGAPISCYVLTQEPTGVIGGTGDQFRTDELCRNQYANLFDAKQVTASGLTNGQQYRFTVAARNAAGLSQTCTFTEIACSIPSMPTGVREHADSRSPNQLGISWQSAFNTQGITYTVYTTYTDASGAVRTETSAGIDGNSYVFTTVPGETYSFSVTANNVCGASGKTAALVLIAGYMPGTPTLVRTQVDAAEEFAICGWSASIANGFPITGYRVAIRTQEAEISVVDSFSNQDVYTNVAPYCQENTSVVNSNSRFATTVSDVRCTVPISQLRLSPYGLVQRQSIACRVIAVNQRGESAAGYGEGAFMPRIRTVPGVPVGVETRLMSDLRRVSIHW